MKYKTIRTRGQGPKDRDQKTRTKGQGPEDKDQITWIKGLGAQDQEKTTRTLRVLSKDIPS